MQYLLYYSGLDPNLHPANRDVSVLDADIDSQHIFIIASIICDRTEIHFISNIISKGLGNGWKHKPALFLFILKLILLGYGCFNVVLVFLLYRKVNQYMCTYILPSWISSHLRSPQNNE